MASMEEGKAQWTVEDTWDSVSRVNELCFWFPGTVEGGRILLFQADCEPLCKILSGDITNARLDLEGDFEGICIDLVNIFIARRMFSGIFDPVVWKRRHHNKTADAACNVAMDTFVSIEYGAWQETANTGCALIVASDGGFLGEGLGAVAFCLFCGNAWTCPGVEICLLYITLKLF